MRVVSSKRTPDAIASGENDEVRVYQSREAE